MSSITQRDSILNDIRKLLSFMILNEQDSTYEFEELVILHYQMNNNRVLDPEDPIPKNITVWPKCYGLTIIMNLNKICGWRNTIILFHSTIKFYITISFLINWQTSTSCLVSTYGCSPTVWLLWQWYSCRLMRKRCWYWSWDRMLIYRAYYDSNFIIKRYIH
jgi:hypothetical protein